MRVDGVWRAGPRREIRPRRVRVWCVPQAQTSHKGNPREKKLLDFLSTLQEKLLGWCIGLYSSLFTVENAVEESPGVGRKVIVRITPYAAHETW